MTFRQNADYTAEYVFTQSTAREEVEAAQTFVAAVIVALERDLGIVGPTG